MIIIFKEVASNSIFLEIFIFIIMIIIGAFTSGEIFNEFPIIIIAYIFGIFAEIVLWYTLVYDANTFGRVIFIIFSLITLYPPIMANFGGGFCLLTVLALVLSLLLNACVSCVS